MTIDIKQQTAETKALKAMIEQLKKSVAGEVRFDHLSRQLYSTDASDYRRVPVGVVLPRSTEDVQTAVAIATEHNIPIIARGGGSSLSGQTVGNGLVIDHSKYMNKIIEINREEQWAEVESGVVLDVLNASLASYGLMVGPDPSSGSVATIGGMAGNNSTGSHSFIYGMMADHIHSLEVVLADGSKAEFNAKSPAELKRLIAQKSLEGELYRQIPALLDQYADDIKNGYPKTWRNVAGYGLNRLLDQKQAGKPFNLTPLIVGSEGTLAAITKVKVGLVQRPAKIQLAIVHFDTMQAALEYVPLILEHPVAAVELMAHATLKLAYDHPVIGSRLRRFVKGLPGAILIVEFSGDNDGELSHGVEKLKEDLGRTGYTDFINHLVTPEQIGNVWQIRKSVFGLNMSKPGDDKPVWIIDDASVPVSELASYTKEVIEAGRKFGMDINFDAHASAGCLHMGLDLNLKTRQGLENLERLIKDIMSIAIAHKGSTTGEHGEGLARSYFNRQLYGPKLHEAFKTVKSLFDPRGLMNPCKIINPIEPWDTTWLKVHPDYSTPYAPGKTFLDFSYYGGFAGLVEMCSGQGFCRSQVTGNMCPIYRVTREEKNSTRGFANVLRAAMTGQLGPQGLKAPEVYDALSLCLECKACRTECASCVDMAKLKYEFLSFYQEANGTPVRSRLFGHMGDMGKVASLFPGISNRLYKSKTFKHLLDRVVNIDERRELPELADKTFQYWFKRVHKPLPPTQGKVVLWDDCHISYHQPHLGRAAVKILEALGFEVICVEDRRCCARPMISKGLLKEATANARHNVDCLIDYARKKIPIIGVEPSCIACFRDEYPDLLKSVAARQVAEQSFFFEEFVTLPMQRKRLKELLTANGSNQKILLHTHCYQKAMGTASYVVEMLGLLPDTTVEEIASGCCGMAGSFGYEKEHYELSMAIGEQVLFPTIRKAEYDTVIAAAGTSCREQIKDGTQRKACHPVEILARGISTRT